MTQSTDAHIAWGIALEEDAELPWDDYDDIEDWWCEVKNYQPIENPYDDSGNYAEGYSRGDPRIDKYHQHRLDWLDENPLPFDLENTCSSDYPMWLMALPKSGFVANRGYPVLFNPASLSIDADAGIDLIEFCKTHGIEFDKDAVGWHLFSYCD